MILWSTREVLGRNARQAMALRCLAPQLRANPAVWVQVLAKRHLRSGCALAVGGAVLGLCIPPPAEAAVCDLPGSQTLATAAGGSVRILLGIDGVGYACDYQVGKLVLLLPTDANFDPIRPIVVRRPYLAYAAANDDFHDLWFINSVNLVTGEYRHKRRWRPVLGYVTDLVVEQDGSMAWLEADDDAVPQTSVVRLADQHGQRVPTHGHHAVAGSLRLRGTTLSWKQRGRHRTTRLQ